MKSQGLFDYGGIRAMAHTDQMVADLKAMADGWLACADADQADINRYDAVEVDALPPAGEAMIESPEDRAKRFRVIREMRVVAVQVRRNCAVELQQYLARNRK